MLFTLNKGVDFCISVAIFLVINCFKDDDFAKYPPFLLVEHLGPSNMVHPKQ